MLFCKVVFFVTTKCNVDYFKCFPDDKIISLPIKSGDYNHADCVITFLLFVNYDFHLNLAVITI